MTETTTTSLLDEDENNLAGHDCHASTGVRDGEGADCGGVLICVLDTGHGGPHYDASEEVWWLPGGSAERHDPTFECRPIHGGDGDTDDPAWVAPETW
jgi:hypothetical protein